MLIGKIALGIFIGLAITYAAYLIWSVFIEWSYDSMIKHEMKKIINDTNKPDDNCESN